MADDLCEAAFSDFLDNEVHDSAEECIFCLLREAFIAGWNAAQENKIVLLPK